jgi:hypothetical protein
VRIGIVARGEEEREGDERRAAARYERHGGGAPGARVSAGFSR